jgi:hypothetical protein
MDTESLPRKTQSQLWTKGLTLSPQAQLLMPTNHCKDQHEGGLTPQLDLVSRTFKAGTDQAPGQILYGSPKQLCPPKLQQGGGHRSLDTSVWKKGSHLALVRGEEQDNGTICTEERESQPSHPPSHTAHLSRAGLPILYQPACPWPPGRWALRHICCGHSTLTQGCLGCLG